MNDSSYQVYMFVITDTVCNETKCSLMGSECGGAIANEVSTQIQYIQFGIPVRFQFDIAYRKTEALSTTT